MVDHRAAATDGEDGWPAEEAPATGQHRQDRVGDIEATARSPAISSIT
jgi:hypothetical protein